MLVLGCVLAVGALQSAAQDAWVLTVEDEIGRGIVSYLSSGIESAEEAGATRIVLVLSTPGGYVDSAVSARDLLLDTPIPTTAYINREALSAGALLALACDEITFAPGGVMGAATAVAVDTLGTMEEAPEKIQSAVITLFRATAEVHGRDPQIAEAMVDTSTEIPGLVGSDKLLTLTAEEAAAWGYSDGQYGTLQDLLSGYGFTDADAVEVEQRTVDRIVETLTSPGLATFLLVAGLLGLIIEMLMPGFGVFGIVGGLCLGAFFWSHVLVGLAGWESIAFVLGGLFAVLLEVFVFTAVDFGLAGIGGLVLIGLGFYTAMVGPFTDQAAALRALGLVAAGVVVSVVVAIILLARLPRTRLRLGGIILSSAVTGRAFDRRTAQDASTEWIGRRGVASTDLHPVGMAIFNDERVDVLCEEGHLPKGTPVVVIQNKGYRKVVRKIEEG